jgi:hypothetical protein
LWGFASVFSRSGESCAQATSDVAEIEIERSRNRKANESLLAPRHMILQVH